MPGAALFTPIVPEGSPRPKATPSKEMKAALKVLHDSITMPRKSSNPVQSTNAVNIVQQEWFKISSTKGSNPLDVDDYLDFIELEMSKELLSRIVNLTDVNGNTALHYSVSHGNFVSSFIKKIIYSNYSTLSNKRASWNKVCRLEDSEKTGNFKNLI